MVINATTPALENARQKHRTSPASLKSHYSIPVNGELTVLPRARGLVLLGRGNKLAVDLEEAEGEGQEGPAR